MGDRGTCSLFPTPIRIVVAGTLLQDAVVPDSALPFNFQAAYGLSDQLAQAISDHYPVEVMLK